MHTNRKPWLNHYKISCFRNYSKWFSCKKIQKTVFDAPPKIPFYKVGFSVPKFKKRPYMPNSQLTSYFANKYLQNKRNRSNFGTNLTFLCQFWVAIPERSNLSIFDHTFKWPFEVLWMPRIKILILFSRWMLGLSKIIFLLFFWHLVWEESLSEFGPENPVFRSRLKKVWMTSYSFLFLFYKLQLLFFKKT